MKYALRLLFTATLTFFFFGCKKEDPEVISQDEVSFFFDLVELPDVTNGSPYSASLVIAGSDGGKVFLSRSELLLRNSETNPGRYESEPAQLPHGSYILVEFLIKNEDNDIILAAPVKESEMAKFVSSPLSIFFKTVSNSLNLIEVDVLDVGTKNPSEFGYSIPSFSKEIEVLIAGYAKKAEEDSFYLTEFGLTIATYRNEELVENIHLQQSGEVNLLTLDGAPETYRISGRKNGFMDVEFTFSREELRTLRESNKIINLYFEEPSRTFEVDLEESADVVQVTLMQGDLSFSETRNVSGLSSAEFEFQNTTKGQWNVKVEVFKNNLTLEDTTTWGEAINQTMYDYFTLQLELDFDSPAHEIDWSSNDLSYERYHLIIHNETGITLLSSYDGLCNPFMRVLNFNGYEFDSFSFDRLIISTDPDSNYSDISLPAGYCDTSSSGCSGSDIIAYENVFDSPLFDKEDPLYLHYLVICNNMEDSFNHFEDTFIMIGDVFIYDYWSNYELFDNSTTGRKQNGLPKKRPIGKRNISQSR